MAKAQVIQVFEHRKLSVDGERFKMHHFDAMVQFNERNSNKYFEVGHKGIKFTSYVGVIQIGGLTIEVLPKADNDENPDKNVWQSLLLHMLRVCKHIQVDHVSETQLKKRYNSILDVYFEMFLQEVELLIKNGLIKKYRRKQSNQNALRGKLLFAQNIQHNLVHKERFYCEHQVYDKEHIIHQILHEALVILDNLISENLKDRLYRVLAYFQDFPRLKVTKNHFEKLNLNRNSAAYSKGLNIAKMILLNYSPNLSAGRDNMLTLLFDMNQLWEEYIYRILQRHYGEQYDISPQNSTHFWEHKTIRPDIVIKTQSETYIIDTKWKVVNSNDPADNDLKQMFAYNLHWKAEKSLLLYPKVNQSDSSFGKYHYLPGAKDNNLCKLGFVKLTDGIMLIDERLVAEEIIGKLEVDS